MTGCLAYSKSGHDKDTVYVVLCQDGNTVYLSDGKYKTVSNPKKKNIKHIQLIKKDYDTELQKKLVANEKVTNEEIKFAIKQYKNTL